MVYIRLRFVLILAGAFAVVANWDFLRDHWQKLLHQARNDRAVAQGEAADIEYWCPMCPGVVSDWPTKCPVCNMGLVRRRRGDMVPSADGSLARMQLSPYRVQLAGIQTTAVDYRPLAYEVVTSGFVQAHPPAGPTDQAQVWVEAEIYEKDLALLAEGQRVEVSGESSPGRNPLTGQVRKLVPPPTPDTRSSRVQVAINNPRSELRPGMFVMVRIKVPPDRLAWLTRALAEDWRDRTTAEIVGRSLARPPGLVPVVGLEPLLRMACGQAQLQRGLVLTVLESAVIDTGLKKVVYREAGPGMFEAVEVVVGPRCGKFRPVLHGLEAGQRVAAAGAFLLDAETRLNPAVATAYFGAARSSVPVPTRPSDPDIAQALAQLSPADRALAARQKTCPVTDKPLGSMGPPVPVEVAGKIVFLCCKGCESELRENADRYLSKLQGNPPSDANASPGKR
jgi:hypothetical protein